MKKITFIIYLITYCATAQVGIGTTTPRAALEIQSENSGIITPQIALTSITDNTTVINPQTNSVPVNGTLIWNTATAGIAPNNVIPGYYYWENNKWIKINSQNTKASNFGISSIDNSNKTITCGKLNPVSQNVTQLNIANTANRNIILPVNNLSGVICNINISIDIMTINGVNNSIDLFLISPDGKILELCTDNGGTAVGETFSVIFTNNATRNITAWTTGSATGEYRPEGTLTPSNGTIPNITTLAGFHNIDPNGNWTLRLTKDSGNNIYFKSATLSISTIDNRNYTLVSEKAINTKANKNILASSTYSVNTNSDLIQTIITRSTTSQINYTPSTTLPPNLTRCSVVTQNKDNNLSWINNYNQSIDTSLNDNTTYYYQLWVLGAPTTRNETNEQYNFIVRTDDKPTN